jgi:hypothetical protein
VAILLSKRRFHVYTADCHGLQLNMRVLLHGTNVAVPPDHIRT